MGAVSGSNHDTPKPAPNRWWLALSSQDPCGRRIGDDCAMYVTEHRVKAPVTYCVGIGCGVQCAYGARRDCGLIDRVSGGCTVWPTERRCEKTEQDAQVFAVARQLALTPSGRRLRFFIFKTHTLNKQTVVESKKNAATDRRVPVLCVCVCRA